MKNENRVTNRQYANKETLFRNAATVLAESMDVRDSKGARDIEKFITTRQASKFRRGKGIVYQSLGRV